MVINHPKNRQKIGKFIIVFLIIVFLLFFLNLFKKEIRYFFYSVSSPIQKFLWQKGGNMSDFFTSLIKTNTLKKEKDELNFKNQELFAEIVNLRELKNENKFLREALEIGLQKDFELKLSNVIGKDISQDFLLIDKGSNDGITEGMPVITQQRVVLGRISEVDKNFSKVMLISDKKSSFGAEIQGKNIFVIVKGEGNFNVILDLVPKDKEISREDVIITSGLGGVFPPGILVGRVKEVKKSDVEPFQYIDINPDFEITEIEKLFVIIKPR